MAQTVLRSLLADLHALERIDDTTEYEPGVAYADEARARMQSYPMDRPVRVYYDPENPGQSVLEPGGHETLTIFVIMGVAFFVTGLVWLARVLRSVL